MLDGRAGYCYIEGRLKEMTVRGGENIHPRQIEQVLFTHPAVADVAVVGVPDPNWGERWQLCPAVGGPVRERRRAVRLLLGAPGAAQDAAPLGVRWIASR